MKKTGRSPGQSISVYPVPPFQREQPLGLWIAGEEDDGITVVIVDEPVRAERHSVGLTGSDPEGMVGDSDVGLANGKMLVKLQQCIVNRPVRIDLTAQPPKEEGTEDPPPGFP